MKYDNRIHALIMRLMKVTGATNELATSWVERWHEPHRFYHDIDHLFQLQKDLGAWWDHDEIFLAAVFHDIIYDPTRKDNEDVSALLFLAEMPEQYALEHPDVMREVATAIIETKHDKPPVSEIGRTLCEADLNILTKSTLSELIQYELRLSKEYQVYPYTLYKAGRIDFLNKWVDKNPNIKDLIKFIMFRRLNIGVYAGSFDPFTIGHQNILHKAEQVFDKVIIARGLNPAKNIWEYALPPCLAFHETWYVGDFHLLEDNEVPKAQRELHLASMMINRPDAILIRGLRGGTDLEAEKIQQIYIQQMMEDRPLKMVYITCDKEFEHISSSAFKQVAKVDRKVAAQCCPNGFPSMWREHRSLEHSDH